jgi:hypothetical protein
MPALPHADKENIQECMQIVHMNLRYPACVKLSTFGCSHHRIQVLGRLFPESEIDHWWQCDRTNGRSRAALSSEPVARQRQVIDEVEDGAKECASPITSVQEPSMSVRGERSSCPSDSEQAPWNIQADLKSGATSAADFQQTRLPNYHLCDLCNTRGLQSVAYGVRMPPRRRAPWQSRIA